MDLSLDQIIKMRNNLGQKKKTGSGSGFGGGGKRRKQAQRGNQGNPFNPFQRQQSQGHPRNTGSLSLRSSKILVSNLAQSVNDSDLVELFGELGRSEKKKKESNETRNNELKHNSYQIFNLITSFRAFPRSMFSRGAENCNRKSGAFTKGRENLREFFSCV